MNPPLNTAFACLVFQTSLQYRSGYCCFVGCANSPQNTRFNGAEQFKAKREILAKSAGVPGGKLKSFNTDTFRPVL